MTRGTHLFAFEVNHPLMDEVLFEELVVKQGVACGGGARGEKAGNPFGR